MKQKKILILLSDAGNGHRSAARAINLAFENKFPGKYSIEQVDLFKKTDVEPFNVMDETFSYVSSNKTLITGYDQLWKMLNTKTGNELLNKYTVQKLIDETTLYLEEEKPHLVISVHPFTSVIVKEARLRGLDFKFVNIITDIVNIMRAWANDNADLVFCPTGESVSKVVNFGVKPERIVYPLFPINPDFKKARPQEEMIKELNLSKEKTTIMVTGGGFGNKSIARGLHKLIKDESIQLLIMCGRNKDLYEKLTEKHKNNNRLRIFGFVNNMYDYMSAADLIFAKPGPGTIMEILVMNKKAVLGKRIGQQEKGNITFALKDPKIRYVGTSGRKLVRAIKELQEFNGYEDLSTWKRRVDESELMVERMVQLIS